MDHTLISCYKFKGLPKKSQYLPYFALQKETPFFTLKIYFSNLLTEAKHLVSESDVPLTFCSRSYGILCGDLALRSHALFRFFIKIFQQTIYSIR